MGFTTNINKFVKKTILKEKLLLQSVCQEIGERIGERTGVDTGILLGTYIIGINRLGRRPNFKGGETSWQDGTKNTAIEAKNREKALSFFLSNLKKHVSSMKAEDKFYLRTKEHYADYVEYIGWEKTPPYRMFGKTIVEFYSIVLAKAKKVRILNV